jgi:hypothetical protein
VLKSGGGYLTYVLNRVKRIYFPVIEFLVVYLAIRIIPYLIFGKPEISVDRILGAFLLLEEPSFGYLWVMRVFLMMAIVAPLFSALYKRIGERWMMLLMVLLVIGCQLIQSFVMNEIHNSVIFFIVREYVQYILGYSPLLILGFLVKDKSVRDNWILPLACVGLFVWALSANGWIFNPNSSKYPPCGVYLSYGIVVSYLLWVLKPLLLKVSRLSFFKFFSENSMWLYLAHIFAVPINQVKQLPNSIVVRYILVVILTVLFFYLFTYVRRLLHLKY